MLFLQRYVERDIRSAHPPQKISKPSLFFNFFINQYFYAENTANLQNRAGREFFGSVQPVYLPVVTPFLARRSNWRSIQVLPMIRITIMIYQVGVCVGVCVHL